MEKLINLGKLSEQTKSKEVIGPDPDPARTELL